jgi:hypothetical protein
MRARTFFRQSSDDLCASDVERHLREKKVVRVKALPFDPSKESAKLPARQEDQR